MLEEKIKNPTSHHAAELRLALLCYHGQHVSTIQKKRKKELILVDLSCKENIHEQNGRLTRTNYGHKKLYLEPKNCYDFYRDIALPSKTWCSPTLFLE